MLNLLLAYSVALIFKIMNKWWKMHLGSMHLNPQSLYILANKSGVIISWTQSLGFLEQNHTASYITQLALVIQGFYSLQ